MILFAQYMITNAWQVNLRKETFFLARKKCCLEQQLGPQQRERGDSLMGQLYPAAQSCG